MPKQTEINNKELQEFWEWCGFKRVNWRGWKGWEYPDLGATSELPELDLNNLLKYAVPKLAIVGVNFRLFPGGVECEITYQSEAGFEMGKVWVADEAELHSPKILALALYQAIQKARRTNEQD